MTSSPATPRPNTAPHPRHTILKDDGKTPTRVTFGASNDIHNQQHEQSQIENANSSSTTSPNRDSMDVDMEESDNEAGGDDNAISDGESLNGDGTKSKKKKSQRFYCTDYPPCNLSFTRSEHLARHIRLDNLRQHAQTVHVNEDIPNDSLAATGSRFQRQMRTERVRQAGNRARASTSGSAGGPPRGHSKSLSTSSINSMGSMASSYGMPMHADRRRPPPLVMSDPRSRMSVESYRSGADSNYSYRPHSPSDFSTPTSATFSTAQSSPRWPSGMGSPTTSAHSHSRSQSMYMPDHRSSGRRLSVPSGVAPFQSHGPPPGRHSFGPALVNSSNAGAFSPPNHGSVPPAVGPASAWSGRRDSTSSNGADDGWRRRTWHPDNRVLNGQPPPLSAQTAVHPNPPPPIATPAGAQSNLRLPGIESFDPLPQRPPTPPRRTHSPMAVDPETYQRRMPNAQLDSIPMDDRRNLNMYDASLQRGINRLDIGHRTPPNDNASSWATEVNKAVQAQGERVHSHVRFEEPPRERYGPPPSRSLHQHTMSAPSFATTREAKRHGWYNGPAAQQRDGQLAQDNRAAQVDKMVHPNFTGFSGFPAREQQPPAQQTQEHPANSRFDALVAVATNESSTATAY
ncbi:C2H2 transcription factor [Cordyceps fumosorosea ARSEF 2679]|uniref:C2H2 transcription factor n=1 Tax=Cordyceps fumosorosea (strain ARSEF 2679) TaxID=1081104 RepID=A0A168EEZ2_CORFA|nr:C2H2 transcription factor [Cordyceps fumosorosea ARSEF 2679]OAA73733.1 C2H2 transcription factor [Cordyceps fumosorosea ARSEF 2679]